jgi:hypothetical protein
MATNTNLARDVQRSEECIASEHYDRMVSVLKRLHDLQSKNLL